MTKYELMRWAPGALCTDQFRFEFTEDYDMHASLDESYHVYCNDVYNRTQ